MTTPTTAELLLAADRNRARSQQTHLGISDIGGCDRRAGYKLVNTPHVNQSGSVVAMIGTAVHDGVGAGMAILGGTDDLANYEVEFAGVPGHLDRYHADTETVVDTKTTSTRWLDHIMLEGPPKHDIWQVSLYASALLLEGRSVKHIQIDYLARDNGDEHVHRQPFRYSDVEAALSWLRLVKSTPLSMLPRRYMPDSIFCLGCPFGGPDGGICWEQAVKDRPLLSALYADNPDAGMWAEQLHAARAAVKEATEDADWAKGALSGVVDPDGGVTQCGERFLRYDARGALKFVPDPALTNAKRKRKS